jgi:hypothetical protein
MTLQLMEGAVNALDAYFEANIAAKVADLNARYPGDTLVVPKKWYLGNLPTAVPEQPSVCIHVPSVTPKVQRQANIIVANEVNLFVFVGHADEQVRWRRLCRYMVGLLEMCHTGEAAMGYHIQLGGKMTITDSMDTPDFLQGITVPLALEQAETY